MTTKESPWPVEETVSRLKGVLESKGIKLLRHERWRLFEDR